jgi:FkbH-like protein
MTASESQSEANMQPADILDEVRQNPTYTNHCRALERLGAVGYNPGGAAQRVAVLSNFTVEPVVNCLTVQAYVNATPLELYTGPYNEHAREILDESSELHRFGPNVVVLLLTPEAVIPGVTGEPWQDSTTRRQLVQQGLEDFTGLVAGLRARSSASILIANFSLQETSPLGVLDCQEPFGLQRAVEEFNHDIADWAQTQERIYIFDLAGLSASFGRERAFDPRMRLLADQPFATTFLPRVARELVRYLQASTGPSRKCLVLDLDNTLWGGILGEDGLDKLQLGGDAIGEGYREFQKAILTLHSQGVILALCSRNDQSEAMSAIANHPEMILRPEHFAAERINWGDKVSNIESIAEELNIGLDSLVFVDDDPFERQNVRERLQDILVVDLPSDPVSYRSTLLKLSVFDRLQVTNEDRARGRMYQERRAFERLRSEATSLDEYLSSLSMEVTAVPAEGPARTRLFQLLHKTNQFNLTTRRYSESEFDQLVQAQNSRVFGISVRDRLGDSGIVGLMVLKLSSEASEIDTFLMSCRVLGRNVETGILAYAVNLSRLAGTKRLRGCYIPTAKNRMVRDLYERHGFTLIGHEEEAEVWEAELLGLELAAPAWAEVREYQETGPQR